MNTVQSALAALIPAADPVVAPHRRRLDSGATLGVPAHVTVLFPFMPPDLISSSVRRDLGRMMASVAAFDVTFDSVGWFGDDVVHLRPVPDDPFRRLTRMVADRWPDWPPYGGAYDDTVPHLTLGDTGTVEELRAAARAVEPVLPITARVDSIHLLTGTFEPDSWTVRTEFVLARTS